MLTGPGWTQMVSHTHLVVRQLLVGAMKVTEPCRSFFNRTAWACSPGSRRHPRTALSNNQGASTCQGSSCDMLLILSHWWKQVLWPILESVCEAEYPGTQIQGGMNELGQGFSLLQYLRLWQRVDLKSFGLGRILAFS